MQRKTGLRTEKPIKKRRETPRRQNRELEDDGEERVNSWTPEVQREVLRRSGGVCEWPGCTKRAREMHHRKLKRYGDHRAVNAVHLCLEHHIPTIHANVLWSHEHGYLVRSTLDPADRPVLQCPLTCRLAYGEHPAVKVEPPPVAVRS